MPFDYSMLCGKIKEKYGTQRNFAAHMEMSERTLSLKLQKKISWKQPEIMNACNLLDIHLNDIPTYFFTLQVQN